jgi:hypothetical protein
VQSLSKLLQWVSRQQCTSSPLFLFYSHCSPTLFNFVFRFAFFILFAGFLIPPPTIPDWWVWLYYISPFHYALEGLLINELVGTRFTCAGHERYYFVLFFIIYLFVILLFTPFLNRIPPVGYPLLAVPYPEGFSNSSICPYLF